MNDETSQYQRGHRRLRVSGKIHRPPLAIGGCAGKDDHTGHPDSLDPFGGRVGVAPMDFGDPEGLARSLEGASALYNTYWIRFGRGGVTFETAVDNTRVLIKAAQAAGVRRVVHTSITNASSSSPLPYFRGKGLAEEAVRDSGLSYAIVRPTLIFGKEDVLLNNIAWALRRFPAFPIYGSGGYRLQPVYVEDVARIAVTAANGAANQVIDAVGPETYTFDEVVRLIAGTIGIKARLVHLPPGMALGLTRLVGLFVNDVVLTRDEVKGLMAGLLVSGDPPSGETRLSQWLTNNADHLGRSYTSELRRHWR